MQVYEFDLDVVGDMPLVWPSRLGRGLPTCWAGESFNPGAQ
jgi:hypothetical protein